MGPKITNTTVPSVREQARHLIEQLPDDATWDDLIHELEIAASIQVGLDEANRGELADDERIAAAFKRAGVVREA